MDCKQKIYLKQIETQKEALRNDQNDLSLTAILSSPKCQQLMSTCREQFRDRLYPPIKTLFIFIKQVLHPDKSCQNAVAGVVAEHIAAGKKSVSTNTGPYCKARQRLPESTIQSLVNAVGQSVAKQARDNWKVYGRELKGVDGSTVTMADTPENQRTFPQHSNQKKGAGFPMARVVAVMSLTVGTVIDYAVDAIKGKGTGEHSLFRRIFNCIDADDILLGDRYYPNFFLMTEILARRADGIFRGQSQRHYDFRTGRILGKKDHIITWRKPSKPAWLDQETYDAYPEEIQIREFKVNGIVYVSTFLNAKKYPKKELATIYKLRWHIEMNLKSLKAIMNMDMLSCKTPEMIRKEIGIHFLAYNVIRTIMAEACAKQHAIPNQVSFKGAVQLLNKFMPYFLNSSEHQNKILYAEFLKQIIKNRVGNRPGRLEPRAVKRRRKPFPALSRPRSIEKARLARKVKRMSARNACA